MGEQRANRPISVNPKPEPVSDPAGIDRPNSNVASTPTSPRGGTKIAQVIELLQCGDGATLAELVAATGWLPHTTRAALTGLRKRFSAFPAVLLVGRKAISRQSEKPGRFRRAAHTAPSDLFANSSLVIRTKNPS